MHSVADSDIRLGEPQYVVDPDIRLEGTIYYVFQYLTFISLLEGGPKSIAKLDGWAMTGFSPVDPPLYAF